MKQKDIILIIVVVFSSAVISIVVSKIFISSPKNRSTQVEVVAPINSEFQAPDSRYFNSQSIDPTQNIHIGNNNNTQPFNGSNQ